MLLRFSRQFFGGLSKRHCSTGVVARRVNDGSGALGGTTATEVPGVPHRAVAGVSPTVAAEWATRAAAGARHPVIWENPGAYAQVARVPDAVLRALPPPRRPHWPVTHAEESWRYARAFAISIVFVVLAVYLHIKARVRGPLRLEMERSAPWMSRFLVAAGFLTYRGDVDRVALFHRIFKRFSDQLGVGEYLLPLPRAVALLAVLRGDARPPQALADAAPTGVDGRSLLRTNAGPDWLHNVRLGPALASAVSAVSSGPALREADFVDFATAASDGISDAVLGLAATECLGVAPASGEALAAAYNLFDTLEARHSESFTSSTLAGLCADIGFDANESDAARCLADARTAGAVVVGRSTRLGRDDFADFIVSAAAAADVPDARVADYLRVYALLHLSGMRERAGVSP